MKPLRKELFWDIKNRTVDADTHKQLIIERVLSLGNIEEFKFLLNHFSQEEIKQSIKSAGYLDPKTLSFVLSFFDLDKEDLKCCSNKQSAEKHWN